MDKAGEEYIGHPLRVMEAGRTLEEKIVGVLHDVVEDSEEWSFERLEQEGFAHEIIEALRCVTKLSETEPYDKFIARVKENRLAVAVKLNDLSDNMDIRRLPYLSCRVNKQVQNYKKCLKNSTFGEEKFNFSLGLLLILA
ncbi:MAG: phosphohydrolase [Paludibacteraceae bacterium]|nr:phosphohydrolase [Paludibacteraceae bacterium]